MLFAVLFFKFGRWFAQTRGAHFVRGVQVWEILPGEVPCRTVSGPQASSRAFVRWTARMVELLVYRPKLSAITVYGCARLDGQLWVEVALEEGQLWRGW